ncbi:MAG TPA: hypothetical protein VGZ01_02280, partial [Trinickia sp.]|nr:hypothetical protein [Trinickia sp.]
MATLPRRLTPTDTNGARRWGLSFGVGLILFGFVFSFGAYVVIDEHESAKSLWSRAGDSDEHASGSSNADNRATQASSPSPVIETLQQQIASVHDENAADAARLKAMRARNGHTPSQAQTLARASTPHPAAAPGAASQEKPQALGPEQAQAKTRIQPLVQTQAQALTQTPPREQAQVQALMQTPPREQARVQALMQTPPREHSQVQALMQTPPREQARVQALLQTPPREHSQVQALLQTP